MKKIITIGIISFLAMMSNEGYSQSANNAYGDNQVEVDPGVFAIYTGDINQDGNIDITDTPLLEADISNFAYGYLATDLNGDGNVDISDQPVLEENIAKFIYSITPMP